MSFVPSTVNTGGQKFAVLPCATPSLFGPSKRALFAAEVSCTWRLATVLSIYFQDTDRSSRLDHLSFDASPLPTQNRLIRRARRSRLSRSGLLAVLSWVRCHRRGSCLAGCTRRPLPPPPAEKISGCPPTCSRDIAGYCPFRCQFPQTCTAKTIRETSLFLRATRAGYRTTRCR